METKETVITNDKDSRGALMRGVDQATVGAHDTITSASDAARPAVDRIAAGAHQIVDKVAGVAAEAAETLGAKGEQLKSAEKKMAETAREYIREHPVAVLGIAVATGYLLSRLRSPR